MKEPNSTGAAVRTLEADVLVIGGGGAGLSAACAACSEGAKVVLLEKNPELGGTTSLSVGSITAAGSSWQKKAGITDTPDEHFADMGLFLGSVDHRDNMALRRVLVDHVTETLEWLKSIGLAFYGPMPEPPHKKPRMHTVLPNSRAYPYYLGREARRLGAQIHCNARVVQLLQDGGRVVGARASIDGAVVDCLARRAVVLASGDISAARDLKRQFKEDLADVQAINPNSTGDGQRMVVQMGGELVNGDLMRPPALRFKAPARDNFLRRLPPWRMLTASMNLAMRFVPNWIIRPFIMSFMTSSMSPEAAFFKAGAILINHEGKRFTQETGQPASDLAKQPDQSAWIAFDDALARKFSGWPHYISTAPGFAYAYFPDYRRTRSDLYVTAQTLPELARKMGVPQDALTKSVQSYNDEVADNANGRAPMREGPFHALGPIQAWVILTDVGLAVDTHHRVLDRDGTPFPGLYAAGSAGQGGVLLWGHGHHIGWAMTSGRRAGRFAAQEHELSRSTR